MSDFASYEKNIEATVVRIKHYIRPSLNMTASELIHLINAHVPPKAVLISIEDDQDCDPAWPPHGELVFEEERHQN